MRIDGTHVGVDGLLILLYMLPTSGQADELALAARINEAALLDDTDATNVELSPAERATLIGILSDPADPLRELARDLRDRQ